MNALSTMRDWVTSTSSYQYLRSLDLNPNNFSEALAQNFSRAAVDLQEEVLIAAVTSFSFGVSSRFFLAIPFGTAATFGMHFSLLSALIGKITKYYADQEFPSLQNKAVSTIIKIAGATLFGTALTNAFGMSLSLLSAAKIEVISLATLLASIPLLSLSAVVSALLIIIVLTVLVVVPLIIYDFSIEIYNSLLTKLAERRLV